MNLILKRLSVVTLISLLLMSGAFANTMHAQDTPVPPAGDAQSTTLPATKPAILGALNGNPLESIPGSYCWPVTDGSPLCDVVDDPHPPAGVNAANGDAIVFTLDPAAPAPTTLKARLLDDTNADGDVTEIDLSTTGGIFTPDSLSAGPHRVEVQAVYAGDVQGNQPFVSDEFLLNIAAGDVAPTTEAPAATTEVTEVTPEGAPATPETVEGAAPTAETPTEAAPAPTEVPPTEVAPTEVAPTPVPETPVPPTETPVPPPPGDTAAVPGVTIYPVVAIVAGRTYDPIAVNICVTGSEGETICINRPTKTTVQRIIAVPGSVAQLNFKGPRPTAITVSQYSSDGSTLVGKQSLLPDNLVLYTLPPKTGTFVLNVEIAYPDGKANYYFRFNIG